MLISFSASASNLKLSVEPYLGYSQFQFSNQGVSDSKFGAMIGGRGGVEVKQNVFLAVDYHQGGPYILEKNENNEYLNRMWGVGIGGRFKSSILWVGYYFDNVLDDLNRNFIYEGTAIKAGAGYLYKGKISFNLEYIQQDFTRIRNYPDQKFNLDVKVYAVSVSAPIYLLK